MPLDGLRAWIGEVERKLRMRTRVFLVLAVIAIGGAGAAIYLAIETRNDSVSESDVQALQEKLEARIDEGGGAATGGLGGPVPEAESAPGTAGGSSGGGGGTSGNASGAGGSGSSGGVKHKGASTGSGEGSADETAGGGSSGGSAGSGKSGGSRASRLEELLEQTAEANARAEREQAEGK